MTDAVADGADGEVAADGPVLLRQWHDLFRAVGVAGGPEGLRLAAKVARPPSGLRQYREVESSARDGVEGVPPVTTPDSPLASSQEQNPALLASVLLATTEAWDASPYGVFPSGRPQLTVMRFSIPAHSSLPWHTHAIPSAAYVISGRFTVEERSSGRRHVVGAGEAFGESVGGVHRGFTGDEPAEIVAVYAGVEGVPTSEPATPRP